MRLHSATPEDVRSGRVTDVYFSRTRQILEARGENPVVRAELVAKSLPDGWTWAVLAGVEEAIGLASELDVSVRGMAEGTLFGTLEPVMELHGPYLEFCEYETAFLGMLCQASGIATRAARCRRAAGDRPVISFGARRMHPVLAPMIERAAYVGGCDGVATVIGAEGIGQEPVGTIPHALVLVVGDTVEATRAFDEVIDGNVPRVSLVDTFQDEKFEAVRVAEEMGDGVDSLRLDTPSTRRGDFYRLLEEVRWELDVRGHEDIQLFVSGGIDEEAIRELDDFADGYGVGGAIAAAPVVDFSLDIVEIEGEPLAKRGKWSGSKEVFRCESCGHRRIGVRGSGPPSCEDCDGATARLLVPLVADGDPIGETEDAADVRRRVLDGFSTLPPTEEDR